MSESKKKKKKEVKKMNFFEFQKQAGGPSHKSMLPSAPGELPSGPGQGGRGYGGRRGGRGGSRYDDRPKSAADSSNQWRSNRTQSDRGPRRSYGGGSSYGDRSDKGGGFGRERSDRGSRYGSDRDREQPESRYDDSVSRSMFGSKKQAPTRINNSFGSGRPPRRDDDSGLSIDRSSFGKKTPLRPVSNRNFNDRSSGFSGGRRNDFEPSSGGYGSGPSRTLKRGFFDGSGDGFGAHLVADLFATDSSGPDRRVNHFSNDPPKRTGASRFSRGEDPAPQPARDRAMPWGKATTSKNQKTPEQIEEEERIKTEREAVAKAERSVRDAERAKKREAKETVERQKAAEKAAVEEREAHLAGLQEDVDAMLSGDPRILTREHLEVVMPQIEPSKEEAVVLGTALAMTVNQETISLGEVIHMIPANNFDTTFINMLSSLASRMGELNFIAEIQNHAVDVFELMYDKTDIKGRLLEANLKCLVGDDETQLQLDEAFSNHVSLKELFEVIQAIDDFPAEMIPKVTSYVFDEFFTNQNVDDPTAWFATGDVFYFLAEKLQGHTEIIDIAIKSWHAHGANAALLVPLFHRLLSAEYIYADQVSMWNTNYENHQAKMEALMAEIDDDEQTFGEWLMNVETEYAPEEEEDDDDDGYGNMI